MMANQANKTDIHDLSLGVIHALKMVDPRALSYAQLRRLYAAIVHANETVEAELKLRSKLEDMAESPRFDATAESAD